MASSSTDDLAQRLATLEAENATLKARLAGENDTAVEPGEAPSPAGHPHRTGLDRSWTWTLLATVLIVIGSLLAPVALAASWAKTELTNTETFVATYAPLADDAAVQRFITDQAVAVVNENVDIPQLTSDVVDGITDLGTGPVATRALTALKGPAAQGITSLVRSTIGDFVSSDAFSAAWAQALRVSHGQLVATMQNDPTAAVKLGSDGSIGVQLGPIIAEVKTALVAQGLTFASTIPEVDRTITVAQSDSVPTAQLAYGLAVAAGAWLPWVVLALLTLGVVVARRRARALVWAATGLALAMALVAAALAIGRIVLVASISPSLLPSDVATIMFDTVVSSLNDSAVAVLILSIVVACVAWYSGPFGLPRRLRGFFGAGATWVRTSAETHGVTTGRFGVVIYRQRVLIRVLIALIGSAIVLLVRPLTPGLIVWTLVLSVLVIAVLELLQRPPEAVALAEARAAALAADAEAAAETAAEPEAAAQAESAPTSAS